MTKSKFRFSSPTVLHGDAPFLGATVQEWDDFFTGNMDASLAKVKELALTGPKRPLPTFVTRTTLKDLLADDEDTAAALLKAETQALDDTSPTAPHDEARRQVRASVKLV